MFSKLYSEYCTWVANNPAETADYETIIKWCSVLLAGRYNSTVIPEFLYAASNLLTLHNDVIILKKNNLCEKGHNIKLWLSVLEYCEIFIEMGLSQSGRIKSLAVIYLIQLLKCAARLYLLRAYKSSFIGNPPFAPIERNTFKNKDITKKSEMMPGPSSGIYQAIKDRRKYKKSEIILSQNKYLSELIFTLKPVTHLSAILLFGKSSWKPYLLSLVLDVLSLYLISNEKNLNEEEKVIVTKRILRLVLYLLRSPFYDRYFKASMVLTFNKIFNNVPFTSSLLQPLLTYLMKIQSVYFYMWSS